MKIKVLWEMWSNIYEAVGLDLYNQAITGMVSKTLDSIACDADHIPCVLITECKEFANEDGYCCGDALHV